MKHTKQNTEANTLSENIPDEVLKEIREYTDKDYFITDIPFAKNHLYCVRGKYCDFAELTKAVAVYIHPKTEPVNTLPGQRTQGEATFYQKYEGEHCTDIKVGGKTIAEIIGSIGSDGDITPEEAKANAAYIVEACNNYQSLKEENERLKGINEEMKELLSHILGTFALERVERFDLDQWARNVLKNQQYLNF